MPIIDWDDSFSVNVKIIDDQHRQLVKLINKSRCLLDENASEAKVIELISEICEYIILHFATEETYFSEFHYPDAQKHIEEHNKFTDKVFSFQKKLMNHEANLTLEIMQYLTDWQKNHVLTFDKQFTKCFNDQGLC